MSPSPIGMSIDCCVEVSANWRCVRMPSRSVVTSARRLFPRRLDHDARGVAGLVGAAVGDEVDAVVVVALPRGVAAAQRVERLARHREASLPGVRRAPRARSSRRPAASTFSGTGSRRARQLSTRPQAPLCARFPTCRNRCLRRGARSATAPASA